MSDKGIVAAKRLADLERENAELALFRSAFDVVSEGLVITDADNTIVAVNHAFTVITGYSASDSIGRNAFILKTGRDDPDFEAAVAAKVQQSGRWRGEVWNRRSDGAAYREELTIDAVRDTAGQVIRLVGRFSDVTSSRESADRDWHRANFDPLTELPNRALFLDRFLQSLVIAGREGRRVALMFVGLDGFRTINDTLGHTIGDKVLIEAARRFQTVLAKGDTVARFGGDEFTVVISHARSVDDVTGLIRSLQETLNEQLVIEGHQILISCSLGVCLWPGDGDDVETLMRNATAAMEEAKQAGRSTFRFFTPTMDARAQARTRLASELSDALQNGEFDVVFQPLVETKSGRLVGAEALLRWNNRYLGAISPAQFVPLAEEMGLILRIGDWLLTRACSEAARWQDLGRGPIGLAINVSPRQVHQADVAGALEKALEVSGLDPGLITLEITEGLLLSCVDEVVDKLMRLHGMGVRIAVDDFGTGYASLSYLKQLPIDILKIDRSFVTGALERLDDARLIEAILSIGHSMGLEVVGEGVETAPQLAFLAERGCDLVQGYYFSPPLSAERFRAYVLAKRP